MLRLFLLRHAQTEYSRADRFCGGIDAPLDGLGRRQAEAFARHQRGRIWTAIYTSTRRRAQQTARPVAELGGAPLCIDPRLDEIDYGDWQGASKTELASRDPNTLRRWLEDPSSGAPGGERVVTVAARMMEAITDIARRHPEGDVLVVSHKTALRALICVLLQIPLTRYRERVPQPVGALTIVDMTPTGPRLRALADTRHLNGLAVSDVPAVPEAVSSYACSR